MDSVASWEESTCASWLLQLAGLPYHLPPWPLLSTLLSFRPYRTSLCLMPPESSLLWPASPCGFSLSPAIAQLLPSTAFWASPCFLLTSLRLAACTSCYGSQSCARRIDVASESSSLSSHFRSQGGSTESSLAWLLYLWGTARIELLTLHIVVVSGLKLSFWSHSGSSAPI